MPEVSDSFFRDVLSETRRQTDALIKMEAQAQRSQDILLRVITILEQRTTVIADIQSQVAKLHEVTEDGVAETVKGVSDLLYRGFAWKIGIAVMFGIALGSAAGDVAGPLIRKLLGL